MQSFFGKYANKHYENHEITEHFENDHSLPPPPPQTFIPNKPQLPRANTTAFCQIQQQNNSSANRFWEDKPWLSGEKANKSVQNTTGSVTTSSTTSSFHNNRNLHSPIGFSSSLKPSASSGHLRRSNRMDNFNHNNSLQTASLTRRSNSFDNRTKVVYYRKYAR